MLDILRLDSYFFFTCLFLLIHMGRFQKNKFWNNIQLRSFFQIVSAKQAK